MVQLNELAPDFCLPSDDGVDFRLSDHRGERLLCDGRIQVVSGRAGGRHQANRLSVSLAVNPPGVSGSIHRSRLQLRME